MGRSVFHSLVFLVTAGITCAAFGQKHVVYPTIPPPPHTPQEILLLFSGNTADERILLTLNNNRRQPLTTSITVYTASGVSTVLPDIEMVPHESKLVELSPLLKAAGLGRQELGWIKLDYSGIILEMGAQLTLYPTKDGPGVDSPRSLNSDFKSTERDAVFWMPEDGKAHLALTNGSTASIFVKMKCGLLAEEFVIPSKTTKIRHIELPDGPIVHAGSVPVSCEIVSDGAVDALRPVGTVVGPGYSAPIRFYDPKTATFQSLTAVGLETTAATHITVHNITDSPVEFVPILREAALSSPYTQSLAPRALAPHRSAEVEVGNLLRSFQEKNISRVTLTLKTTAPKGAFIGAVTQISSTDRLVEDIPLKTSNPPAFARGSYPLRWDEDYTNLVTVTNTAEETLRIGGEITAGDMVYVLTRTDIDPGATIVFDVDKFKRDGIPDINGKTIPKDAQYGKFHWIEMSNGKKAGLLGRTSLSSVLNHRKSSFSCGSTCDFHSRRYPFYNAQVFTWLITGGQQISDITEYDNPVNGIDYTYPINYQFAPVSVSDSTIVSTGADPNSNTSMILTGNSPGSTIVSYDFFDQEFSYEPNYETCDETDQNSQPSGDGFVSTPVQHNCPNKPFAFACWISSFFDAKRTKGPHHADDVTQSNGGSTHSTPPLGTPVYAMEDGTVLIANTGQPHAPYPACKDSNPRPPGNYVKIKGTDNYTTLYFHMNPSVTVGQQVTAGQQIGVLDDSGCQSAPHLHVGRKDPQSNSVNFTIPCENPLPTVSTKFDDGSIDDNVPDDW